MRALVAAVIASLSLVLSGPAAFAQDARQVTVERAETFIPDLMQIDWIRVNPNETVVQFQFLRDYCGAYLNPPNSEGAFKIVDARNRQTPPFVVQRSEGIFPTWGRAPCGHAGDTFRLFFAPLPANVTHINVFEAAGGYQGIWSWYNIEIR